MAAGYARHFGGERLTVRSAGSDPGERVNPSAVEAMNEDGIDISKAKPCKLEYDAAKASDVIITMGCGDACPTFEDKRYEDWSLSDPAGQSVDAVRPIRDEIRTRVEALVDEIAPSRNASAAA